MCDYSLGTSILKKSKFTIGLWLWFNKETMYKNIAMGQDYWFLFETAKFKGFASESAFPP